MTVPAALTLAGSLCSRALLGLFRALAALRNLLLTRSLAVHALAGIAALGLFTATAFFMLSWSSVS